MFSQLSPRRCSMSWEWCWVGCVLYCTVLYCTVLYRGLPFTADDPVCSSQWRPFPVHVPGVPQRGLLERPGLWQQVRHHQDLLDQHRLPEYHQALHVCKATVSTTQENIADFPISAVVLPSLISKNFMLLRENLWWAIREQVENTSYTVSDYAALGKEKTLSHYHLRYHHTIITSYIRN